MSLQLYVWDFHGVLEKDNEKVVIEISNEILKQAGFKERFTPEDNERFYGLKWYEYFERLLPYLPSVKHLELQAACFKYAEDHLELLTKYVKPNDFAAETLELIAASGNRQIVISNSRPADIIWFLETVGLKKFFTDQDIVGVNAHQTHRNKSEALKSYLDGQKFDKIIVIGDSEDDIKLGKTIGAVTYYYKHPGLKHNLTKLADHTIHDLRQVANELK